ncbi:MAG: DUF350 domain-containing protein [Desulfobulbaceae bacterium]
MNIATSLAGLGNFALYFGASVLLLALFVFIYSLATPYREIALIREGNIAAACSLGGALLGFSQPLARLISQSVDFVDMLIWAVIALIVQVLTYLVIRVLFPKLVADIPAGKISKGLFLGLVAIAVGMLNAACMTY